MTKDEADGIAARPEFTLTASSAKCPVCGKRMYAAEHAAYGRCEDCAVGETPAVASSGQIVFRGPRGGVPVEWN